MSAITTDMHAHYYGGLVDGLKRRTARPTITVDDQRRLVLNAMTASTVMSPGYTDLAARLADLDRAGIDRQLLTFPGALGVDVLPINESRDIVLEFNDVLAEICKASAGRFVGLGGLPLDDMAAAASEMRRLRTSLNLAGAILPGNYFLTAAHADLLRPVFASADATGALLMVHPGLMAGESAPAPYPDNSIMRASALNLQASLSHMALTLLAGDILDAYPNVTFQVVNLGGTLPFIIERMEAIARSREMTATATTSAMRRLVYDTASLGPRAIELAVKVIGSDRIMYGTDYPIFPAQNPVDVLHASDVSAADREMIASGTSAAVLAKFSLGL
jgi:predicted TIM-barrel fold metal-dependent hydrolase